MKILCVEDDQNLAKLLQVTLVKQRYQVDLATDGQTGYDLAESSAYDLILLDLVLPKLDGIRFCKQLRAGKSSTLNPNRDTPILLMTAVDTVTNKVIGLDAGADDYVVKPFDLEELLARIRALLRRNQGRRSPVLTWGELCLNPNSCEVTYQGQRILLASKEYEILELFLRNPEQIFSPNRLLQRLWVMDEWPSEGAVRAHIKGLRQKLRLAGSEDVLETIYKLGYRLKQRQAIDEKIRDGKEQEKPEAQTSLSTASSSPATVVPNMWAIWLECQQSYSDRLAIIQQAVTALQMGMLSPAQQHEAEREAHTLIGSLGSFGLNEASELSRQIQQILNQEQPLGQPEAAQLQPLVTGLQHHIQQYGRFEKIDPLQPAGEDKMDDRHKTKEQLIAELQALREQVAILKGRGKGDKGTKGQGGEERLAQPKSGEYIIVLVEDSKVDRAIYRKFLRQDYCPAYQIIEFDNGTDALAWCEKTLPDVLLIDYFLPDMEGLEFLQRLRQQTGDDRLPVIMITGQGNTEIAVDLLKSGAQNYLDKSHITPEILHQAIAEVLGQNQLIQQQKWLQQRQQLITKTALYIRQSLKLDDILNVTVTGVREILQCDRVIIYQFGTDWNGVVVTESVTDPALSILGLTIQDNCYKENCAESYRQGRTSTIDDIYADTKLTSCHRDLLAQFQVRANMVVPILQQDNLWGLLIAHHCTSAKNWTSAEVELMNELATQAGIAIQQAALVEQQQTELAQRRLVQAQLQAILDNSTAVIYVKDLNGKYLLVNREVEKLNHLNQTEIIGRTDDQLYPQSTAEKLQENDRQVLASQEPMTFEETVPLADGIHIYITVKFPLYNAANEIYAVCGISTDITQRKQAELALKQLNAELENRIAERTAELIVANNRLKQELLQRKQIERALRESEARYRQIVETGNEGIWILDANSNTSFVNPKMSEMLGYTVEEMLGASLFNFMDDEGKKIAASYVERRRQGITEQHDFKFQRKDGSALWAIISTNPIIDDSGQYLGTLGMITDITDRKRIEDEREHLIDIIEATSDIVGTSRFDTQKTKYINKAGRRLFGIADDAPIDHILISDVHPQWALDIVQQQGIPAAMQNGIWMGETAFLAHDGREIPISQVIIGHTSGSDEIQYISTISRDISEQKQIEASLKESNRRWRSLLDNVQLIVVGLDCQGNVDYINPFFLKLTKFTQAEVVGKHWFTNFIPHHVQPVMQPAFTEVIEQELHSYYQNPILTKSGEERLIAWNNTILRDVFGQVIGTMSIGEDITERDKLDRMKAEFVAVVSHELRTPLTSMQAALSLLNEKIIDPTSEEGQATIEIATEGVNRLVRLVNQILDLERLESGKICLGKRPCDTAELISIAIAEMQEMASQSGIILETTAESLSVYADPDCLLQVFTNLLSNAIKFSAEGSTVHLSVELQPLEDLGDESNHQFVLFTVRDHGRGIPSDRLERIFERFEQVDASDSRAKGGTGLGLTICRNIIQHHGGRIWVESIVGQGSSFYFTLPMQE